MFGSKCSSKLEWFLNVLSILPSFYYSSSSLAELILYRHHITISCQSELSKKLRHWRFRSATSLCTLQVLLLRFILTYVYSKHTLKFDCRWRTTEIQDLKRIPVLLWFDRVEQLLDPTLTKPMAKLGGESDLDEPVFYQPRQRIRNKKKSVRRNVGGNFVHSMWPAVVDCKFRSADKCQLEFLRVYVLMSVDVRIAFFFTSQTLLTLQ